MSELDEFIAEMQPRLVAELREFHNGDPGLREQLWSHQDPVTLFGAAMRVKSGWAEISEGFRSLASRWSDCTTQDVEIVAAGVSGDLAYTVVFEHSALSIDGVPAEPYTLRVTQVYRRENGEWRVVHRHGDSLPTDQRLPGQITANVTEPS